MSPDDPSLRVHPNRPSRAPRPDDQNPESDRSEAIAKRSARVPRGPAAPPPDDDKPADSTEPVFSEAAFFEPDGEEDGAPGSEGETSRRQKLFRKRVLFVVALVFGLAGAVFLAWQARVYAVEQAENRRLSDEARVAFASYMDRVQDNIRAVAPMTSTERSQLRRSLNATHIANGERFGIPALQTRDDLEKPALKDRLVQIEDTRFYHVLPANYSVPYLTPDAVALLDSIGTRFHARLEAAGLPLFQFGITSALRSSEDQTALTGRNVNAARGVSSHQFATTFDISNRRYSYGGTLSQPLPQLPVGLTESAAEELREEFDARLEQFFQAMAQQRHDKLQAVLGRVMIELENEGMLVVVLERRQPVFHTTVSKRLGA